jgi:hypothetical protein
MKGFLFDIDLPSLVRKRGSRYVQPIDFVNNYLRLLPEESEINIIPKEKGVIIKSSHEFPASLDDVLSGNRVSKQIPFMPPSKNEVGLVVKTNGSTYIFTDEDVIDKRVGNDACNALFIPTATERSLDRLTEIYSQTNRNVIIDGNSLRDNSLDRIAVASDEVGSFDGSISYTPETHGGISFFKDGRFVETKPYVPGLTINLHNHEFDSTITYSRVIMNRRNLDELKSALSAELIAFTQQQKEILSDFGYQVFLRSVGTNAALDDALTDIVKENLLFEHKGKVHTLDEHIEQKGFFSKDDVNLVKRLTGKTPMERRSAIDTTNKRYLNKLSRLVGQSVQFSSDVSEPAYMGSSLTVPLSYVNNDLKKSALLCTSLLNDTQRIGLYKNLNKK